MLGTSAVDPDQFGGGVTVVSMTDWNGDERLYAGSWLRDNKWLLVINQRPLALMSSLFALRRTEILIITMGFLAIFDQ